MCSRVGLNHKGAAGESAFLGYLSILSPTPQARSVVRMEGVNEYGALGPRKSKNFSASNDFTTAASTMVAGFVVSGVSHQAAVTSWAARKYLCRSGHASPPWEDGRVNVDHPYLGDWVPQIKEVKRLCSQVKKDLGIHCGDWRSR